MRRGCAAGSLHRQLDLGSARAARHAFGDKEGAARGTRVGQFHPVLRLRPWLAGERVLSRPGEPAATFVGFTTGIQARPEPDVDAAPAIGLPTPGQTDSSASDPGRCAPPQARSRGCRRLDHSCPTHEWSHRQEDTVTPAVRQHPGVRLKVRRRLRMRAFSAFQRGAVRDGRMVGTSPSQSREPQPRCPRLCRRGPA